MLAISGLATVYGIYVLYSSIAEQPAKSALHRSNAVHRTRSARTPAQPRILSDIEWMPDLSAPMGKLRVWSTSRDWSIMLDPAALDESDMDRLTNTPDLRTANPGWLRNLRISTAESVLHAATHPFTSSPERVTTLREKDMLWLLQLRDVMLDGDIAGMENFVSPIQETLHLVTAEQVRLAITRFTQSTWFTSDAVAFSDPRILYDAIMMTSQGGDGGTVEEGYAATEDSHGVLAPETEPTQGLKGLLYHIAEGEAKRKAYEHRGIHCEECGERPIKGIRWHCLNCPDFDLCSTCESNTEHQKTHVFSKIKIPLPVLSQPTREYPLWYPGDPRKIHAPLAADLKKRLSEENGFSEPQIDAHFDQFTCLANVPWLSDPSGILAAIDRRAFNKAMASERWPERFRPNALYDRIFAFYDSNDDGLIGFEEFLSGVQYLRGPERFKSLRRALEGFDIDGDGYVDRADFVRLFRAKFEIQKLLIDSMIETRENEITRGAMDTLRSSLPISSIFNSEDIPQGEQRPRGGKRSEPATGDMLPTEGTKTILRDDEGWPARPRNGQQHDDDELDGADFQPREANGHHQSRFEELLHSTREDTGHSDIAHQVQDSALTMDGEEPIGSHLPMLAESDNIPPEDPPLNDRVIWQVIEDGFHEMLDPLFKSEERLDLEVTSSEEEREQFSVAISEVIRKKQAEGIDIGRTAARGLRVGAGGIGVSLALGTTKHLETDSDKGTSDSESMMGDDDVDAGAAADVSIHEDEPSPDDTVSQCTSSLAELSTHSEPAHDPTMPQNMPNTNLSGSADVSDTHATRPGSENAAIEPEDASYATLMWLAHVEVRAREIRSRGGPGRLSFREIEKMVENDGSREIKGLVTSWLEWASF